MPALSFIQAFSSQKKTAGQVLSPQPNPIRAHYKSIDDLTKAGIPQSTIDKIRTVVAVGRPFEAPPEKGMVWVNLDSKRYHKETSAWYGRTKNGKYMSEADAVKAGYKEANVRTKKS